MVEYVEISINIAYGGLLLSMFLALIRLVIGPTLADRVVSLDIIAFIVICLIGVYTIDSNTRSSLDIAVTLALVAFLGTISFALFIQRGKKLDDEQ